MLASPKSNAPSGVVLCYTTIDKAIKTLNLYSGRGELAESSVSNLLTALGDYLKDHNRLAFEVTAAGLMFEGERLNVEDKLAPYYFYLFKDGVRELIFLPGVEPAEVRTFLQVLLDRHTQAGTSDDDDEFRDHDTVTMLWEANLQSIQYHAIDAYAAGEVFDPDKGTHRSLADQVADQMQSFGRQKRSVASGPDLTKSTHPSGVPAGTRFPNDAPGEPDAARREQMRAAADDDEAHEMERFAVVWARLLKAADKEALPSMARLMIKAFEGWMKEGNWSALHRGLKIMKALSSREDLVGVAQGILSEVSQPESLARLHPFVVGADPETIGRICTFFGAFGRRTVNVLARMLTELPPGTLLDTYLAAYTQLKWGTAAIYVQRLRSKDNAIVLAAVAGLMPDRQEEAVMGQLRMLLGRREPELRYRALKALEGDEDVATLRGLMRAMVDPNQDLRAYAIRRMGAMDSAFSRKALMSRITDKNFQKLHVMERRLLLTTAGRLGGPEVQAWFSEEIGRQSFFGGKKLKAWQIELTNALREAGSDWALALLETSVEE